MTNVCAAITRSGTRCTVSVGGGLELCHLHDPARAPARKRAASKAGRSRPDREIVEIRSILCHLTEQVIAGEILTGPAAVAGQLLNTRLRCVEVGRRLQEQQELLERLAQLEERADLVDGGSRRA